MVQGVVIDENNCIVNRNPATGEIISRVPCTSNDEIEEMIERSRSAFPSWSSNNITSGGISSCCIKDRIDLLRDGIRSLSEKEDDILPMMVNEMGKTMKEAKEEFEAAISKKDDFLNLLEESLQPKQHGRSCQVVRNPIGVVVILSPWNFPVDEILLLLLPALGSGNTVIVKPSEVTPETGAYVVQTIASHLPANVLQLAQGDGNVGKCFVSHPKVNMIAMTGSCTTGKQILQVAAPQMKKIILELGGKDPMIVFDDVKKSTDDDKQKNDKETLLHKAVEDAVSYSLYNCGQVCCAIERVYVAETIYDTFQNLVVEEVRNHYQVGYGDSKRNEEGTNTTKDDGQVGEKIIVGPMVSIMQRNHVQKQVDDAVQAGGAKLLYQSDIPLDASKDSSFYPITVLSMPPSTNNTGTNNIDILSNETFGPIVTLVPFDGSEEEAIRLANNTDYGLASSVYTNDIPKAQRIANAINAGQVGINCYALDNMDVSCPWYVELLHSAYVCLLFIVRYVCNLLLDFLIPNT